MEDISVPIDVESNGEEVAEIDSRQAKKATAIPTSLYKPTTDDKLLCLFDEYSKSTKGSATDMLSSNCEAANVGKVSNPLMQDFDQYSNDVFQSVAKSELELYLEENKLPRVENYDVLGYWKQNESRLPVLSQMARDILVIPLSTVASESAFSVEGRVLDAYRSSLKPKTVEAIICLRDWLYGLEALTPVQLNLDDLCGDVLNVNIFDDKASSLVSKSGAGSGVGQMSALGT